MKISISRLTLSVALCAAIPSAFAQQANVNLDFNPQKNTENLVPYGGNIISPEVKDDHTVTFRLKAPDVSKVELAGGRYYSR